MEDWQDKTEAPTEHKRAEARRLGNIPRSADLCAAVLCLGAVLLLQHFGPGVSGAFRIILTEAFSASTSVATPSWSPGRIGYLLGAALAPMLVGMLLVGTVAHLAQTGFLFRFRAQSIDPAKGIARLFSGRTVVQLVMNALKLALVGFVAYHAVRGRMGQITALQAQDFADAAPAAGSIMVAIALRIAGVLLVLGLLDYAYQRFRHERELRMTRREVKEEQRRVEGSPETRRRRRQAVVNLAAARLDRQVSSADVVLAGRDVAVAVRFNAQSMLAPRIVARGSGDAAGSIRDAARRHGVTVIEREALAASLSRVAIHHDVPQRLFAPVAEAIAYAYAVRGGRAN